MATLNHFLLFLTKKRYKIPNTRDADAQLQIHYKTCYNWTSHNYQNTIQNAISCFHKILHLKLRSREFCNRIITLLVQVIITYGIYNNLPNIFNKADCLNVLIWFLKTHKQANNIPHSMVQYEHRHKTNRLDHFDFYNKLHIETQLNIA